MAIYHKHHIIPRHNGGSDDPSNIIELTIEEHAEAHRVLYEEQGRWQDKIAWLALSGSISTQEAIKQSEILGGKKGAEICKNELKGFWDSKLQSENAKKSHKINKEKKKGFWNPEQQKELAKRGAAASGLGVKNSGNHIKLCCLGCKKETSKPTFAGHHNKKCFGDGQQTV
jgi:hypothetical protein